MTRTMIPIVHRIEIPVRKPMMSRMIPMAIMISPSGGVITGHGRYGQPRVSGRRGDATGLVFCRESGRPNLSVIAVRRDGVAHHFGRDDRELTAFGPRPRPEL